ncbi:LysR family transcriptional regulator [Idiomarina abyssalis]|uniref:LysR family transcriptional regulator n=2 Tax=Idiomarina abyssalis TaxID=86102 RepID=UPI0006C89209|nr:LysR family transcriptional regulator [Idiomarina abyssalis]KPD21344.1 LysR family transcriptional regulator [Idiomarina abyssalis]SFT70639.1 DNA-binding transcriptional regulator, LysR family [Idiomarina abyssalis]
MNLSHLHMMITVARLGSLQKTAEQLGRTQSAVSMALKKLEENAGFALFNRDGYRLELTEQGHHFLRQAEEVVRQQQRLQSLANQLKHGAEPLLTLCYDHTCDSKLWMPSIQHIQQQYPATELHVDGESQMRALKRIDNGTADLALCPWLPLFRQYGDFETLPVAPFELTVVMSAALMKEFGRIPQSRQDLLELPMLVPQNLEIGINLDSVLRLPSQQRIRVNEVNTQFELLMAGFGWGIIPKHIASNALKEGKLVEVSIPGFVQQVRLEIHLVRSANRTLGPAANAIWERFA